MDYSSDKPIKVSEEDRYSRKEYARSIAKILSDPEQENDFVIGMYSKWGYGKSSVLTMVKEFMGEEAIVIPFNPWIFENQTAIVTALLFNLAEKLDEANQDNEEDPQVEEGGKIKRWIDKRVKKETKHGALTSGDTAAKLIRRYSGLVGIGLNLATGNAALGKGSDAILNLAESYLKTSSIDDVRGRIEKKISDTGKKIVIIIDDLDRLDKDEIFQLLKIVKIIADFEGVTYLVAFDDEAVAAAISEKYPTNAGKDSGRAFLEKIIQVPLNLPAIPQRLLNKEVFTGIDELLKENDIEIADSEVNDFRFVYDDHISRAVDSPRAVTRFLNSLKFTLPFVGKEVNIADFLLVEALRIFFPSEYEKLRHEKEVLTGVSENFSLKFDDDDSKSFKEKAALLTSSKPEVMEITKALFPAFKKRLEDGNSSISHREFRREKRVASPDYFERYFSYGVVNDDVSDIGIINILKKNDYKDIAAKLGDILKIKNQELALTKVDSYKSATKSPIALSKALLTLEGVLDVGEGGFSNSPVAMAAEIIGDMIQMSDDRLAFSTELLDFVNDPALLFYLIREVLLNSKVDSDPRILTDDDLLNFQALAAQKISSLNAEKPILKSKSDVAYYLFYYWSEFGDKNEAEDALKAQLVTPTQVIDFVVLHLSKISGGGRRYRGNLNNATYENIKKIISMDYLVGILTKKYPKFASKAEFRDIERDESGIGTLGNERKPEFRERIAEQLFYQHAKVNEVVDED